MDKRARRRSRVKRLLPDAGRRTFSAAPIAETSDNTRVTHATGRALNSGRQTMPTAQRAANTRFVSCHSWVSGSVLRTLPLTHERSEEHTYELQSPDQNLLRL